MTTRMLGRTLKILLLCLAAAAIAVAIIVPTGAAAGHGHGRIPEKPAAKVQASSTYADESRAELRAEYLGGPLAQAERRTSEFEH